MYLLVSDGDKQNSCEFVLRGNLYRACVVRYFYHIILNYQGRYLRLKKTDTTQDILEFFYIEIIDLLFLFIKYQDKKTTSNLYEIILQDFLFSFE